MATTLAPLDHPPSRSPLTAIRKIFHPSDFTPASEVAFRHALKISQVAQAELTVLHVAQHEAAQWTEFPGVREWLERWGVIPPGSGRDALQATGLRVQKIIVHSSDTVRACLHYLDRHPSELLVLGAAQQESRAPWPQFPDGAAEPRSSGLMTLFLPDSGAGFVDASDGAVQLRRILVPIAARPDPQRAVQAAARLVHTLGLGAAEFTLLHIGDESTLPEVQTPAVPGWSWRSELRSGAVAAGILEAIAERIPDLVVMATDGTHGFLDGLRGNVTECILHRSQRPLLAVPGDTRP